LKKKLLYAAGISLSLTSFFSFSYKPENTIYATEIEAIENIENSETESAEPIFYPITDEQINIAITEFFKQKNSCYMDGTDMSTKTYTDTYQMYVERIRPLFYEINYSTDFFLHRLAYSHEIYQLRNSIITNYEYQILELKNKKVQGNQVQVTAKERVTYQDSNRKEKSGWNMFYVFTYLATEDGLKLFKIEIEEPFYGDYYKEEGAPPKEVFDSLLADLYQDASLESKEIPDKEVPVSSYQNTILYDGELAASYAKQYALTYNSLFPSYAGSGGDCANFGSQSVWAGLGGKTVRTLPMLTNGVDTSRLWYQGSTLGATGKYWNWTSTSRFYNYVMSGNSSIPGLYGIEIPLEEVRPGDIVQVDYSNNGRINHTIIVTGVDHTNGTNNKLQITYSAHTGDRTEHPLSEFGYRAGFRAIRIYGMVTPTILSDYWKKEGDYWRYVQNGQYIINDWGKIGDSWYYFNENGVLKTGWLNQNDTWYFFQENGKLLTDGSLIEDNTIYFFDTNGKWIENTEVME